MACGAVLALDVVDAVGILLGSDPVAVRQVEQLEADLADLYASNTF
jgi:hypothetical protein